jgi:hypothetical protein
MHYDELDMKGLHSLVICKYGCNHHEQKYRKRYLTFTVGGRGRRMERFSFVQSHTKKLVTGLYFQGGDFKKYTEPCMKCRDIT